MNTQKRFLLLAILLGIIFINTPEIHYPEHVAFIERESPLVAAELQTHINRTLQPLYSTALLRIQKQLHTYDSPVKVIVDGNILEVRAAAVPEIEKSAVNTNTEDMNLFTANSLTAEQWDAIVAEYNPAIQNTGGHAVAEGQRTKIDNAYVLAMWIKESTVGTAGVAVQTKSSGNIRCFGYPTCIDGFRAYPTWNEGLSAHFDLLRCYGSDNAAQDTSCNGLWNGKKHTTIGEAIDTWAPPTENNTNAYKDFVIGIVKEWRSANTVIEQVVTTTAAETTEAYVPFGSPLNNPAARLTQGYGVGSHSPAETWGGIDLAVSSEGGETLYTTHSGIVRAVPNSWPGGNCILVVNDQYRTTYCHMASFAVETGTQVQRGDIIGTLGSTGNSTGPHVHYEVWKRENGREINVNPLDYNAMEGL